ncbi:hypothetical protein BJY01DRAFT_215218 [Aspergillus pseudoustus]|uniref:Uncharacterized protein n=1 Tax=Aspergillus pseudoustus TaxID=1810923 RepID=A0ABR4JVT5_9EURO
MNFVRYFRGDPTSVVDLKQEQQNSPAPAIEAPTILVSEHPDPTTQTRPQSQSSTMSRTKRAGSGSDSGGSTYSNNSPPQTFPLAHPPPKSKSKSKSQRPRGLRLSSRLLLQIQQLHYSSSSPQNAAAAARAIPILELYQPSTFGKSVGARKAHSRDMYLVQSEPFVHLRNRRGGKGVSGQRNGERAALGNGNGNGATKGTKPRSESGASRRKSKSSQEQEHESSGEENEDRKIRCLKRAKDKDTEKAKTEMEEEEDVVAVIHTSPKPKSKGTTDSPPEAELYFPLSGSVWDATSPSPGHYRFMQDLEGNGLAGDDGVGFVFSWENRPPSASSSTATEQSDEGDRFVLSVSSGRTTSSRRPWLAQLTRRGLHVGGMDAWQRELRALMIDDGADGAGLYTLIVTMGVWVARKEGWVG